MPLDLSIVQAMNEEGAFKDALFVLDSEGSSEGGKEYEADKTLLRIAALNGLGRWKESISLATHVMEHWSEPLLRKQLTQLHGLLGVAYMRIGSTCNAESHYRAAIHVLTWELGDIAESVRQQKRLALMFHGLGMWQQARFEMEKAIEIADRQGLIHLSGTLRLNLAITCIKSGGLPRASSLLDEARTLFSQIGQAKCSVQSDLARANILRITGEHARALALLTPALHRAQEELYLREEAIAFEYIGDCYLGLQEPKKALHHYESAMKIAEAIAPEGDIIPELCHRMGEALVQLGDPNAAIVLCERGLRVASTCGDRYEECATHRVYAIAHRAAGNPRKAQRIADEGIDLCHQSDVPYELARTLAWAGEVRVQSPALDEQTLGRRQLWEARGILARMGIAHMVTSLDHLLGLETAHDETIELADSSVDLIDMDRDAFRFGIVTCSSEITDAVAILHSVAPSQIPVLITGESGVGKELLAHALHQMSPRRKAPFVPVNCAAISVNLLDSEFFGHERGAFTGAVTSREGLLASADKGSLFLDEVGDLPLQMQAALLRVLETGEVRAVGRDDVRKVDIRIVAATNAGLEEAVARGTFRRDLFYRLNGIRVNVPPLRDREEDIRVLFRFFWSQTCSSAKKRLKFDERVESLLCSYGWPGNVRELRHEVARVVALAPDGSTVGPDAFLRQLKHRDVGSIRRERDRNEEILGERQQILVALRAHRGNKAEAARSLGGMKRTTLIYKMERLGIRPEDYLGIE